MNKLDVLYEDNHIIVVIKPHNLLSQSDITSDVDLLTMVKEYVKVKYNKKGNVYIGLVHRLDRPTRGVMVFARSSKAASRLCNDIKNHQSFNKEYICVVHGKLEGKGTFKDYLEKVDKISRVTDKEHGKLAELDYEVLDYSKDRDLSLVKVILKTGRHHQIRVQFKSRGYPLFGDQKYGNLDHEQLCLTATKLEFIHPVKKEKMVFECDIDTSLKGYSPFFEKKQF